jgi:hypothetical protein
MIRGTSEDTYNLAIEIMLLDHDRVYALGVPEGEKAKSTGAASRSIAHDGALADLSELREVVFQRIWSKSITFEGDMRLWVSIDVAYLQSSPSSIRQ